MKWLSINLNGKLTGSGISKTPLGVSLAFLSKCFTISRPTACEFSFLLHNVCTAHIHLHDPSSFYLIVYLFYQMDSGQHHNIYVRVYSSTGLNCMYL